MLSPKSIFYQFTIKIFTKFKNKYPKDMNIIHMNPYVTLLMCKSHYFTLMTLNLTINQKQMV